MRRVKPDGPDLGDAELLRRVKRGDTDAFAPEARFDNPKDFLPASGAGGTEWDSPHRCFIQTDEAAVSKGLPTHADAARAILSFLREQLLSPSMMP